MPFRHLKAIMQLGLKEYLKQVWFLREFRGGTFVGADAYGNRYYEMMEGDGKLPFYRKRYVELDGSDEASKVPADWHGWLHYTNDDAPSKSHIYIYPEWGAKHTQNLTGTPQRYVPYSTTERKIKPYLPKTLDLSRSFVLENATLSNHTSAVNKSPSLPVK